MPKVVKGVVELKGLHSLITYVKIKKGRSILGMRRCVHHTNDTQALYENVPDKDSDIMLLKLDLC